MIIEKNIDEDEKNTYEEIGKFIENSLIDMKKMDTKEIEKILITEVSNEKVNLNDCIVEYNKYNKRNVIFEDGLDIPFKDNVNLEEW